MGGVENGIVFERINCKKQHGGKCEKDIGENGGQ